MPDPPNSPISRREVLCLGAAAMVSAPARPWIPDELIAEAYQQAASKNVLASVNPKVFPGYFSVCADGRGFGYGNTYPSLDGHQLTDALLWLGEVDVAQLNFDYVRSFQRDNGLLPIAVLPTLAGKKIGPAGYQSEVAANGGLYTHWVPGNPLAALADPTYIQNADVIFRCTMDKDWLAAQIGSVNRAADHLASLVNGDGAVRGGGYYVERPTRLDCDGVSQPHAVDAFRRAAALNRIAGDRKSATRHETLAKRIQNHFIKRFWMGDRFAEYLHPKRGFIHQHGFTDTDWCALAFGLATPHQSAVLWPKLKDEARFYYGGMPTGIATEPGKYEAWEFSHPDRMDLAAMGRVWYLECQARARMGDARGLVDSIRRVASKGRDHDWYWRERYNDKGGYGAEKYCEYPANLIRIVERFLLGVELRQDGSVVLAPTVPDEFWRQGFGQTLRWRGRTLDYRMNRDGIRGTYTGSGPLRLAVRPVRGEARRLELPAAPAERPHEFQIRA
jgi:hypothetical protein